MGSTPSGTHIFSCPNDKLKLDHFIYKLNLISLLPTFFNIEAKPQNFSTLPKIYLATIGMTCRDCLRNYQLPWQLYFERHVFPNLEFSSVLMKKITFLQKHLHS